MKAYLAIDPGATGALALLLEDNSLEILEFKKGTLVGYAQKIKEWSELYDVQGVMIEKVHAMPGQGVTSMFSFGQRFGELIGLCVGLGVSVQFVTPKVWQKELSIKTIDKLSKASRKIEIGKAISLMYPHSFNLIHGPKGGVLDGVADAIGIAHYFKVNR